MNPKMATKLTANQALEELYKYDPALKFLATTFKNVTAYTEPQRGITGRILTLDQASSIDIASYITPLDALPVDVIGAPILFAARELESRRFNPIWKISRDMLLPQTDDIPTFIRSRLAFMDEDIRSTILDGQNRLSQVAGDGAPALKKELDACYKQVSELVAVIEAKVDAWAAAGGAQRLNDDHDGEYVKYLKEWDRLFPEQAAEKAWIKAEAQRTKEKLRSEGRLGEGGNSRGRYGCEKCRERDGLSPEQVADVKR